MNKLGVLKQYVITKYGRKFSSKESLKEYQEKRIKKHISYVMKHSPFFQHHYRNHLEEINNNRWDLLPVIDKTLMMDNFDTFNTVGIQKEEALKVAFEAEQTRNFSPKIGEVSIGLSSGTSGNRGVFLVSDNETALWAGTVLAKVLPGSLFGKHRIAFFLRANNNLYSSTQNERISFNFFDLLDDFSVHINKLNALQPTIIIGPPSILREISEWKKSRKINIQPIKIVSVAEVLEDIDKNYIESIFNQTLHQVYQCTEGFLASTCSHGTLHINEDLVVIQKEYLDKEKGIFVPIITDFSRTTQPIIRYRLNDILIERQTPCPCGSHFLALERIDGRCDDLFYGKKQETNEVFSLFPDFIRRAIMFASNDILEYKVIQKSIDSIEVMLKTKGKEDTVKQEIIHELAKLWQRHNLEVPFITFRPYDIVPSDKKLKRVENQMKEVPNSGHTS